MTRPKLTPILAAALAASGYSRGAGAHAAAAGPTPAPILVHGAPVESRVLPRVLEVTGALTADEAADIAAERDGQGERVVVGPDRRLVDGLEIQRAN